MRVVALLFILTLLPALRAQTCTVSDIQIADYRTPNHPNDLKKVHYTYSCPITSTIYITSLGQVQSAGTLTYLSEDKTITLSSLGADGSLHALETIDVVSNQVLADSGRPEVPRAADFSDQARSGKWSGHDFSDFVSPILDQDFGTHEVLEVAGANKFITAYHVLKDLPPNVLAEVAVEIVYSQSTSQLDFHLVSEESRSSSNKWVPGQTDVVLQRAQQYADKVFAQVEGSK
jgi:hypothetical protein